MLTAFYFGWKMLVVVLAVA